MEDKNKQEREAFEAWLRPYWSRDKYMDPDGDLIYRETWVQGAWIAWQALSQPQAGGTLSDAEIIDIADDTDSGRTSGGRRLFSDRNLLEFARAILARSTADASNAAPASEPAPKRLIGWRTDNYLWETSDPAMAKNWEPHHTILPIFEGDSETKLAAPAPAAQADTDIADFASQVAAFVGAEDISPEEREANAKFYVAAHTAFPALIARIRELEDDRDSWAEQASQRVADWQREHDLRVAAERRVGELERASLAGSGEAGQTLLALLERVSNYHHYYGSRVLPKELVAAIDAAMQRTAAPAHGEDADSA